jgi:hypothetical protein
VDLREVALAKQATDDELFLKIQNDNRGFESLHPFVSDFLLLMVKF